MNRMTSVLMVALGVSLVLLGLLFFVGAAGLVSRYIIAVLSMLVGALSVGFGLRLHRRLAAWAPAQIRAEVLALAREKSGEVSSADLGAVLGRRMQAVAPVMQQLEAEGACQREIRGDRTFFVFEGLLPRMVIKRCAYCEHEASISEQTGECPQCGGKLQTVVTAKSLSRDDELYSMDE